MIDFIFFLFRPSYWLMNSEYSKTLDDELIKALKTEEFTNISYYYADIGGMNLWIANHPYGSFTWYGLRPSRRTIYEANKKLGNKRITKAEYQKYQIDLFRKIVKK